VLWLVSVSLPLSTWPRMRANLSLLAASLSVSVPMPVSVAAPDTSRLVTLVVGLIAIVPVLSIVPVINVIELLSSNSDPVLSSAPCVVPSSVLLVLMLVSTAPPVWVVSVPPSIVVLASATTLATLLPCVPIAWIVPFLLSKMPPLRTSPPAALACKVPVLTNPAPLAVTALPPVAGEITNSSA